jgi:hypothetical protein
MSQRVGAVSRAELEERVRVMRKVKEPSPRAQEESLAEQLSESGVRGVVLEDGSGVMVEQKRKPLQVDADLVVQLLRQIMDGGAGADERPLLDAHGEFFEKFDRLEQKMKRKIEQLRKKQSARDRVEKRQRIREAIREATEGK